MRNEGSNPCRVMDGPAQHALHFRPPPLRITYYALRITQHLRHGRTTEMSYRVGISGLGRGVGPARIFELMPDCTVAAACDLDPAAQERFGEQFPGARLV